jgi:peptide/nickel transport system ATP-binding protein
MGAAALLSARGIEVSFPGAAEPAIQGVDLDLHEGAALGIVGETGSGKTTLARVLVGALSPTAGEVTVEGRSWRGLRRTDERRRHVQMVFQDPIGALNPYLSARRTVAEVFRAWWRLGHREANARAVALLAEVGLRGDVIERRPPGLSGGECQRVGIARALACEPTVLVADEPTSSLDVSVQAQILNLLDDLRTQRGLALLLISHDLDVVRHMTDSAIVMSRGRVVESGDTDQLLTAPQDPYTQLLVESAASSPLAINRSLEQTAQRRQTEG